MQRSPAFGLQRKDNLGNAWDLLEYPFYKGSQSSISYSFSYEELDAIISAGATLDEIEKFLEGGYSKEFTSSMVAWHRAKSMIQDHAADESSKKAKKKNKNRGRRNKS